MLLFESMYENINVYVFEETIAKFIVQEFCVG